MDEIPESLLGPDEPAPVSVCNPDGASPFLIVADHAGNLSPARLGRLGVSDAEWARHIGLDIGIAGVCRHMADALDATLIQQDYSRLIIDCNRTPGSETSIPEISESTPVPGNVGLTDSQRDARRRDIFRPYHDRIATALDERRQAGRPTALIAMHSFTPVYKGETRRWQVGVLYNRDPRFGHLLMALLRQEAGLTVGDNEPYAVTDDTDYTIPVHGERRGLHHTAVEIRQDLIAHAAGQQWWGALMARLVGEAYAALVAGETGQAI